MKKKQISFTEKDEDVLKYIEEQANQSQYLIRLARDDMQKPKGPTWAEVALRIEKLLEIKKSPPNGRADGD